jgi:glycosyltransferase involved in cell wall biosynthesis
MTEQISPRVGAVQATRVAVLHLGRNGGGPKFTLELARALRESGAEVISVIARDADNRADFEQLCPTLAVSTFTTRIGALLRLPLLLVHAVHIRRFLARHGIDAVVVGMEQIWQAPLLPLIRAPRRPVLLCVHDARMHPGDHNRLEHLLRATQRRSADGALTFSTHVAEALEADGPFPSTRIWRSVHGAFGPLRESPRALPSRVPVVGFFGRISEYKGLDIASAAVQALRRRGRRVRLRVVGTGSVPALEALTHEDDQVELTWVEDDDIPGRLDEFDVLLLPYREASQSGVFAYAMSRGLPMVATPVGGLIEQAESTRAAMVAAAMNAEAVADALEQVLDNAEEYAALSRNGLAAARATYSWARTGRDALQAVERLTDAKKPATAGTARA